MDDKQIALHFPFAGISVSAPFFRQPNVNIGPGKSDYARTTPCGNNVRGTRPDNRGQGGSRHGLSKWLSTQVNGNFITQDLRLLVTDVVPGGGDMQSSLSGRVVILVAVSQGEVRVMSAGETAWTTPTNNTGETPPLVFSGLVRSAPNGQILYFADGTNWAKYVPLTNSVETWAATAGTLPVDSDNNTPRLICTWRGRTVLSGLLKDPHNIFWSKVDDPTDFDYAPLSPSPTDAIAANLSPFGLIGDMVTALIPYTDDVLVVGGDHTIYMIQGDPMYGGQSVLISDITGMAWGEAWCRDPSGVLYFFGSKTGIYSLIPGQAPVRISQQIERLIQSVDTGANSIRLIWNDRYQGFHVFVTPTAAPTTTAVHLFYETRTGAWWTDAFKNKNHNPLCCCVFDGNLPTDRVALVGSWDGYVRSLDPDATDDDGFAIESELVIGPLTTDKLDDIRLKDVQTILGETSGQVTFSIYVGTSAEKALAATPVVTGTWEAGRNVLNYVQQTGHGIWIGLSSTNTWAMEQIRLRIKTTGKVSARSKN